MLQLDRSAKALWIMKSEGLKFSKPASINHILLCRIFKEDISIL